MTSILPPPANEQNPETSSSASSPHLGSSTLTVVEYGPSNDNEHQHLIDPDDGQRQTEDQLCNGRSPLTLDPSMVGSLISSLKNARNLRQGSPKRNPSVIKDERRATASEPDCCENLPSEERFYRAVEFGVGVDGQFFTINLCPVVSFLVSSGTNPAGIIQEEFDRSLKSNGISELPYAFMIEFINCDRLSIHGVWVPGSTDKSVVQRAFREAALVGPGRQEARWVKMRPNTATGELQSYLSSAWMRTNEGLSSRRFSFMSPFLALVLKQWPDASHEACRTPKMEFGVTHVRPDGIEPSEFADDQGPEAFAGARDRGEAVAHQREA